jgi:hypothetical protein
MGDVIEVLTTATNTVEVAATGPQGTPGVGVPTGGSALQVLRKASGTDYDTEWASSGGGSVDLSSPDPIGDVTPNTGAFTTLSATGTATLPHIHGSLAGNLYLHVKNVSGGQLTRGTPVYIVGNVGDTDRVEVAAADFDDATKMPAVGLLEQTLANNGSGDAIILGELDEANTNAYTINQELFVGNNGTLTATRPTTGQVQSAGVVARVNSNTGVIVVNMQGQRSPNETFAAASHAHGNLTNDGKIGTTANLPLKTGTNGVIEAGAFGTSAGSFCAGDDARLSDDRDPNLHAASHLAGGADEIFNQSLGTGDNVEFNGLTVTDFTFNGSLFAVESIQLSGTLSFSGDNAATNAATTLDNLGGASSGSITASGLTQSTARILGRTTASTGAIEEIQIGSGLSLSAGELSSTVSAGIPATLLDAKGDLIVASAADTVARLPVGGTNGHVLTVDSAETLGVKWAAAAGGVGGGTGSTDNSILRSDGTGGSTLQDSAFVIADNATASPNNTVNHASIQATGGSTNVSVSIVPKGTGALSLHVPDATSTGGNARGTRACDFQRNRSTAAQVASGDDSFIAGGNTNTASGANSFIGGGIGNVASGSSSACVGSWLGTASSNRATLISSYFSTASQEQTTVINGNGSSATQTHALAVGHSAVADLACLIAEGFGAIGATGSSQALRYMVRGTTTTNSAVELFGGTAANVRLRCPSGKVMFMDIMIVGVANGGGTVATFQRQYAIKNVSGTTSEVYAPVTIGSDNAASTSITVDANDTNDALRIQCTGLSATTIRWVAHVSAVEVAYG